MLAIPSTLGGRPATINIAPQIIARVVLAFFPHLSDVCLRSWPLRFQIEFFGAQQLPDHDLLGLSFHGERDADVRPLRRTRSLFAFYHRWKQTGRHHYVVDDAFGSSARGGDPRGCDDLCINASKESTSLQLRGVHVEVAREHTRGFRANESGRA